MQVCYAPVLVPDGLMKEVAIILPGVDDPLHAFSALEDSVRWMHQLVHVTCRKQTGLLLAQNAQSIQMPMYHLADLSEEGARQSLWPRWCVLALPSRLGLDVSARHALVCIHIISYHTYVRVT